jgi:Rieske Fe-S protein
MGRNGNGKQIDASVSNQSREGLTGTTPASVYAPLHDPEQVTQAPDGQPIEQQPAWRRDFPIDWPQDIYVARRDFGKFMVLTSFAFVVGQFWIAAQNIWRRKRGRPPILKIAALAQVPVGGTLLFNYPQEHDTCLLIRTAPRQVLGYGQKCTHLSCAVIPKCEAGEIHCPCHEGVFDLASGRPLAGPPRRPLPRITLEIRGDDVYATGIEWRTV